MASFVTRLSLALSFIALALAGFSIYQNTHTAMKGQLKLTPNWLDNTLESSVANLISLRLGISSGKLSDEACIFSAVKEVVDAAIDAETRMAASLIRLFFHDCFVDGCDAGLLLNDTPTFTGEQTAGGNNNSVRGFEVIEQAKQNVKAKCPYIPVSCADILSIAARDSFTRFTGETYTVTLGRGDARTANLTGANTQLVGPDEELASQIQKFADKGFTETELVALLGVHTVGFSRCPLLCVPTFINPARASTLQCNCPVSPDNTELVGLDPTPLSWDKSFYSDVANGQGLLFSDNELMNSNTTSAAVRKYRDEMDAFLTDFAAAMVKMSLLPPSAGVELEIRDVCSEVNANTVASM
ncbi:PREDICTED: anionic peroxidase-like [Ipomoea nil]|uniref:anionic peroxidase-like n=1 Tax=Ipomoea nil TaxID=35883 RepID=UPI0009018757|nr:PREDICTED: anionic peroxidase-like [Ipomoea nil]